MEDWKGRVLIERQIRMGRGRHAVDEEFKVLFFGGHHVLQREELQVTMWLARPAMLAGIEEREQSSWRGLITLPVTPIVEASICHAEVFFLEDRRLRLVGLGGDDEVVMDDGEFIQHQVVRCLVVIVGDRCNEKLRGRICEWVEFGLF